MARPASNDPMDRFRFSVSIDGFTRLGFTTCDTPSYEITTKSYPEGGQHLAPLQIIDSISFRPVTLTRGVTADLSFDGWAKQFIELVNGHIDKNPTSPPPAASPIPSIGSLFSSAISSAQAAVIPTVSPATASDIATDYRKDVVISHLNRKGKVVKTYTLYKAFPIQYEVASSFSSDGDDILSMEKIVLAYESFHVTGQKQDSNPFDIRDVAKRLINRA